MARRRRRRFPIIRWTLLAAVVCVLSFGGGLLVAPIDFTVPPPPRSAVLLDRDGRPFATIRAPENRAEVKAADIPELMRQAMVSAEDKNFLKHDGVDPSAVVRAALNDARGGTTQGASTITEQYVKNVYVGSERSAVRKIKEAALAIRLEQRLTKQEILTRYLNTLFLGHGAYGVQAASKYYFGVPISQVDRDANGNKDGRLALARVAMLAGMAPAPSDYNPVDNIKLAQQRQLYVLNRMVEDGYITSTQADAAYRQFLPIVKMTEADQPTEAPEMATLVQQNLKAAGIPDDQLFTGLNIRTTLNLDLQRAETQAMDEVLAQPDDPLSAIVAIDPKTGDIEALKSRGFSRGGFDYATNEFRSTGSTIKPFTLATALEQGISPDRVYYGAQTENVPCPGAFNDQRIRTNVYTVSNAGDSEAGSFSLRRALWYSVNTVYAPLAINLGLQKVMTLADAAGLRGSLDPTLVKKNPRTAHGVEYGFCPDALGPEVTPLSNVNAYSTLFAGGVHHSPRTILDARQGGNPAQPNSGSLVVKAPEPKGDQAIPANVANTVVQIMQGVVDQPGGTAYGTVVQPFPVYGKTGTTDKQTNAWFIGCMHEPQDLCLGVWMGYKDQYVNKVPHSLDGTEGVAHVYGGTLPARIFNQTLVHYREQMASHTAAPAATMSPAPTPTSSAGSGVGLLPSTAPTRRRYYNPTAPATGGGSVRPTTGASAVPTGQASGGTGASTTPRPRPSGGGTASGAPRPTVPVG